MYSYKVIIEDGFIRLKVTDPASGIYAEIQHSGELTDEACQETIAEFFSSDFIQEIING